MSGTVQTDIFPLESERTLGGIHESGVLHLDVTQELARISMLQQGSHASIPHTALLSKNSRAMCSYNSRS